MNLIGYTLTIIFILLYICCMLAINVTIHYRLYRFWQTFKEVKRLYTKTTQKYFQCVWYMFFLHTSVVILSLIPIINLIYCVSIMDEDTIANLLDECANDLLDILNN